MKGWKLCLIFIFPLLTSALGGEDTVAEDIGVHQLERLVEMLTVKECEDLLRTLSHPEENIFHRLERLSPKKNLSALKSRTKRDTSLFVDSEAQCQAALTEWLLQYGDHTYYDRLTRALQHIGRSDIAIEVGKNINQDKVLKLKRYVDGYHKYVSSLNIPSVQVDPKQDAGQKVKKRTVRDLSWRDLDLIVERAPVPPYMKGPMDVFLPVLYGFMMGFTGTLFVGVLIFIIVSRKQLSHQPRVKISSSCRYTAGEHKFS
ncbi:transmembrane and death domain protein 1-like [Solea solea]|uniref:transmembrane and death domain protein 1-like n=1 Tax=Solea solea TaxID=90069 RepID=UPI00272C4F04|nr:transmembrane and death domain protein 1-like [Solea solea]